jgi:hypothetical protein
MLNGLFDIRIDIKEAGRNPPNFMTGNLPELSFHRAKSHP